MSLPGGYHTMRERDASDQSAEAQSAKRGGSRDIALVALMPILLAVMVTISACSEQITKHGHMFRETDLAQVQPGMGQEQYGTAFFRRGRSSSRLRFGTSRGC